jgi:hypothetical protein
MRTKIVFFLTAALAAYVAGCGSSSDTEPGPGTGGTAGVDAAAGGTGGAMGGTGGMAATGGTAGVDASTGGAGGATGGTGGGDAAAGTGGGDAAAGTGGATGGTGGTGGATGGTGGTGGIAAVCPNDPCGATAKALPYTVGTDFTNPQTIPGETSPANDRWVRITTPDCTGALPTGVPDEFLKLHPVDGGAGDAAPDAGADATMDAMAEASDDGAAADAGDDGAAEAGDDGAVAEAGTDDAQTDATDAGSSVDASMDVVDAGGGDASTVPACWSFYYNPDPCIAAAGTCWAGVIFESVNLTETAARAAPGVCIAEGATKLTFEARAVNVAGGGTLRVKFGAGWPGEGSTEQWLTVTSSWASYNIPIVDGYRCLSSQNAAGGVFNGFSAVVEPQDHAGGMYLQVRNMVWSAN